MQTIPRNHTKRIAELTETLTVCNLFSRDNQYTATAVEPRWAWQALQDFDFAKLVDNGDGKFTVRVHDERWFELYAADHHEAQGGQQ